MLFCYFNLFLFYFCSLARWEFFIASTTFNFHFILPLKFSFYRFSFSFKHFLNHKFSFQLFYDSEFFTFLHDRGLTEHKNNRVLFLQMKRSSKPLLRLLPSEVRERLKMKCLCGQKMFLQRYVTSRY